MYLEQLQLNGVTYHFQAGTNAVIGPNGSGKSRLLKSVLSVLRNWAIGHNHPCTVTASVRIEHHGVTTHIHTPYDVSAPIHKLHYSSKDAPVLMLHGMQNTCSESAIPKAPEELYSKDPGTLYQEALNELSRDSVTIAKPLARLLKKLVRACIAAHYDNPREAHGIVLLDEIETGMDISLQRTILPFLRDFFPNLQFIVSTHSPFIVQTASQVVCVKTGKIWGDTNALTPEDITEDIFDIPMPQRSKRHHEMVAAAKEYYKALKDPEQAKDLDKLKEELDRFSAPFSNDPAYMALLQLERESNT